MNFEKCEHLEQKMLKELKMLDDKYSSNAGEMAVQDLDKIDKLVHALKSLATYNAMKEAEESNEYGKNVSGHYMNRPHMDDIGESPQQSYAEGYSRGYSEGQMSGYHPMYPNNVYPRRW